MPTILLAEGHPQVSSALQLAVEQKLGWEVCETAADVLTLAAASARRCPDLILLDGELSGLAAGNPALAAYRLAELVRLAHRLCPAARLVVISSVPGAQAVALASGAQGFVSKSDPVEIVLKTLESVMCS